MATKNTTTKTTRKAKGPSDATLAKAHAAVVKARQGLADAREAGDAAKVARARKSLATAMERRQGAMRAYRDAGGRVVDMQRICEFSSSGATLFALNGGKTSRG